MLPPQPVIEIALRAEVLRRDKDAPARPERARQRNRSVSRIAVESDVYSAGPTKQGQPRRLPAAGTIETARVGGRSPEASTDGVSGILL